MKNKTFYTYRLNVFYLNNISSSHEAADLFGGAEKLIEAFYKLQETIYKAS